LSGPASDIRSILKQQPCCKAGNLSLCHKRTADWK